jgi:hypothetical protein
MAALIAATASGSPSVAASTGSIRSIAPAISVATRVGAAVSLGGPGSTPKRGRSSRFALPVRIA